MKTVILCSSTAHPSMGGCRCPPSLNQALLRYSDLDWRLWRQSDAPAAIVRLLDRVNGDHTRGRGRSSAALPTRVEVAQERKADADHQHKDYLVLGGSQPAVPLPSPQS